MNTRHKLILAKMTGMHSGLLRFSTKGQRMALEVNVNVIDTSSPAMFEFASRGRKFIQKLVNKPASLSQVMGDGYLHISGTISTIGGRDTCVVRMNISKAHWFEKKQETKSNWLEEISFYG